MNALSMESIFLILSGAVLAAGILYWLWSHIQLMQKKVQLLENAVFELRGLSGQEQMQEKSPVPEYKDEDDEEWPAPVSDSVVQEVISSTPLAELKQMPVDLQPGGRIEVPQEEETNNDTQGFRELFIQQETRVPTPPAQVATESSLESMPVKELRRLAEQRGLTGVSELRKKELLAALRNQLAPAPVVESFKEERTLDLTEDTVVLE